MPTSLKAKASKKNRPNLLSKCQSQGCLKDWKYSEGNQYYCREHYFENREKLDEIRHEEIESAWKQMRKQAFGFTWET